MPRSRPNPPIIHMLVALLVVLAPALIAVAWFQRVPEPPINKVDYAPVVAAARAASPYDIAVPRNLPADWVCTRARWTATGGPGLGGTPSPGNTFQLGFLTSAQIYLAVDQRDTAPDSFVTSVVPKGRPDGTSSLAGRTWERYASGEGRTRGLVLREADHVTIVSGDVAYPALEAFASTLEFKR